jgi:3',5'-cyclic AMP phosphodiesterase CpdA
MGGERYYTFKPKDGIRFFALDSNYMDKEQLAWLERELRQSGSDWKICFFHHPLYSSGGRHGSNAELRSLLEPLLLKYSVDVVFTGHDHFYERTKPQKGVSYFVVGAGGKLRKGDIRQTNLTAKAFDADNTLLLAEIAEEEMHFQAISRIGSTVDSGIIRRKPAK